MFLLQHENHTNTGDFPMFFFIMFIKIIKTVKLALDSFVPITFETYKQFENPYRQHI